ncbi:MAG TPA: hypothetical protein VFR71_00605 [Methyloceanibacter sp.]|nr:hypothetical protein [Methyloceanibacter sp.]
MATTTRTRVPENTAPDVNREIRQQTEQNVQRYAASPSEISNRLRELDRGAIKANAAGIAFVGVLLGALVNPWWLLIPALVTIFLFQHALQGCAWGSGRATKSSVSGMRLKRSEEIMQAYEMPLTKRQRHWLRRSKRPERAPIPVQGAGSRRRGAEHGVSPKK